MKKVILISSVFLSFLIAINCGHKKENKNGNEGMTVSILPVTPIPTPPDVDSTQPNNEEQYQSYFSEHSTDNQESSLINNSETSSEISNSSEASNSEENKDSSSISTPTPTPTPTPTTIPMPKRTPRPKK